MSNYKYDVAISVAGEQRPFAEELAKKLVQCNLSVFYDKWEFSDLWGEKLSKELHKVFNEDSLIIVPIFSKEYNNKYWPSFEFEQMMERESSTGICVYPVCVDHNVPKSWAGNKAYLDAKDYSVDEIAMALLRKVRAKRHEEGMEDHTRKKRTMTIIKDDGTPEIVEVIFAFKLKDSQKEYIIYTKNERDSHGYTTVFVSEVRRDNNETKLYGIEDEMEWNKIKEAIYEFGNLGEDDNSKPMTSFFDKDGIEIM